MYTDDPRKFSCANLWRSILKQLTARTRLNGQKILLEEQRIEDNQTMMEVMETSEELDDAKTQEEAQGSSRGKGGQDPEAKPHEGNVSVGEWLICRQSADPEANVTPKVTKRAFFDVAIGGKATGR
eukprot:Skav226583  [mRNA]  locus=scaffold2846:124336:128224:- [translate_table: standard]